MSKLKTTDRHTSLTVLLDSDYRDDQLDDLRKAISMLSGVISVELGEPSDMQERWAANLYATQKATTIYQVAACVDKAKMAQIKSILEG